LVFDPFSKICRENSNFVKLARITGALRDDIIFITILRRIFLGMRNVQTKVAERIKTHILCSVTFSRENGAVMR
jgi:hypothetical protein